MGLGAGEVLRMWRGDRCARSGPRGEVIQSFAGDEEDLEVDVLLYGEPVSVTEDRSDVFTGAGEQPGS